MTQERCDKNRHWWPPQSPKGTRCECGEKVCEMDNQRPPFAAGNELRVTHGAGQPQHPRPAIVAEVQADADKLIKIVAHLSDLDRGAVVSLLVAERAAERLLIYTDENPDDRGASELLRKWLIAGSTLRAKLGLNPLDRAKLKLDTAEAVSIVDQLERGRTARLEREKRGELPPAA